jgi:hypothetical protein
MTWMIEATSQFEIPCPILRSSVWPRRNVPGTGPCVSSAVRYGMQHPDSCYRYSVVKVLEHVPRFRPRLRHVTTSRPETCDHRRLDGNAQTDARGKAWWAEVGQ